ncbi:MAG: cytochrome P450 [Sphingobium sp.]
MNQMVREKYPSHVPAALLWDHDINEYALELPDPFVSVARLHDGPEIVWATGMSRGRPGWLPTTYDAIYAVAMDYQRFGAFEINDVSALLGVSWKLNPHEIDPPDHIPYRQILQPWFQPGAIARLDQALRDMCRRRLDALSGCGTVDFVHDFARYFPSEVFLTIMGLPLDQLDQFLEWEAAMIRGPGLEARAKGAKAIMHYLEQCVEDRRRNPGDDLLTAVVTGEVRGRPMDHDEIMGMCMLLYGGGLDTVLSSLGWHMHYLARDPELQARLRANPADIGKATNELLRAFAPTQLKRTVMADCEFRGVFMKKGDWISLPAFLAARDPAQFTDPHRIDIDRKQRNLTFGVGPHNCLGIHLARREVQIVLEEVLARFGNIRLQPGETVEYHTTAVWGIDRLPIAWDPL